MLFVILIKFCGFVVRMNVFILLWFVWFKVVVGIVKVLDCFYNGIFCFVIYRDVKIVNIFFIVDFEF